VVLTQSGARATVLKLNRVGRKLLRKARTVSLVVRGNAYDGKGGRVSLSRTVLLRR
jgi:hypothetical protein